MLIYSGGEPPRTSRRRSNRLLNRLLCPIWIGRAPEDAGLLRTLASAVLGRDYLSPPLLALMVPDAVRCITGFQTLPGLAETHERAFEQK